MGNSGLLMMKRLVVGALLGVIAWPASAQDSDARPPQPITIGERFSIVSRVLGEERAYWVSLPASYHDSTFGLRSYPVLYLLDGPAHFHSASGMVQFMSAGINGNIQVPELIVIAIPNTNRNRDYTPTHSTIGNGGIEVPSLDVSGGGDRFLEFIGDELFPTIDAGFRTLPYRVLMGHSFGGLLTVHALQSAPGMFQSFIAIDPSLWWDDQVLVDRARRGTAIPPQRDAAVYISLANNSALGYGDPRLMEESVRAFAEVLESHASPTFRPAFQYFESEDHGSVPLLSLYYGLLHTFDGYEVPRTVRMEEPDLLALHFQQISDRLGVTLFPPAAAIDRLGSYFLYFRRDADSAIDVFRFNVTANPGSSRAHNRLADAYAAKGDTALAITTYRRALELDPTNRHSQERLKSLREVAKDE